MAALALGVGSHIAAADEGAAPEVHVAAAAAAMLGSHQYWNSGGMGAQVRIGARGAARLGGEALFSLARMSGGEGRAWANPFEPTTTLITVRAGPRWDFPIGRYELSAGLHAAWVFHDGQGRQGVAGDVAFGFEHLLTEHLRVGLFATGMRATGAWYVEAGPSVRALFGR